MPADHHLTCHKVTRAGRRRSYGPRGPGDQDGFAGLYHAGSDDASKGGEIPQGNRSGILVTKIRWQFHEALRGSHEISSAVTADQGMVVMRFNLLLLWKKKFKKFLDMHAMMKFSTEFLNYIINYYYKKLENK
jgi:hypothetical protein